MEKTQYRDGNDSSIFDLPLISGGSSSGLAAALHSEPSRSWVSRLNVASLAAGQQSGSGWGI